VSKILVTSANGGLGDSLCELVALRSLRHVNPDCRLGWVTCRPELAPPGVEVVDKTVLPVDWNTYRDKYRSDWPDIRDVTLWDVRGWPLQFNRWADFKWCPLPDCYCRLASTAFSNEFCNRILDYDDRKLPIPSASIRRPYAVIQGGENIASPYKWPLDRREAIANILTRHGLNVIALSGEDTHNTIPNTTRIFGLSVRESASIIDRARIYVGSDTGISWIATLATSTCCLILKRPELGTAGSFRVRTGVYELDHTTDVDVIHTHLRELIQGVIQ
jgi:hypothetical protein